MTLIDDNSGYKNGSNYILLCLYSYDSIDMSLNLKYSTFFLVVSLVADQRGTNLRLALAKSYGTS